VWSKRRTLARATYECAVRKTPALSATGDQFRVSQRSICALIRRQPPARLFAMIALTNELRRDLRAVLIHAHHKRRTTTTPSPAQTSARTQAHTATWGSASHTVNHGRYLLFDWPAAWVQPRAPSYAVSTRRAGHLHRRGHVNQHMTSFGEVRAYLAA
jgi:hypothetical protein